MRSVFLFFLVLFPFLNSSAQIFDPQGSNILDPIEWEASFEKQNDSIYDLVFTASLEPGWHLYSQEIVDIDIAPIPTAFTYNNSPETFQLVGKTVEPDVEPIFDKVFEANITFFENEVSFRQKIKVIDPEEVGS